MGRLVVWSHKFGKNLFMVLSTLWFAIHKADGMSTDDHGGAICFAVGLARLHL